MIKARNIILVWVLILVMAPVTWPDTSQENLAVFKSVEVRRSPEFLEVILEVDGEFGYQHFELRDPSRLVVEFSPVGDILAGESQEVDAFNVKAIRVGRFQPQTARVVFDLAEAIPSYEIIQVETGIKVIFRPQQRTTAQPPVLLKEDVPEETIPPTPQPETHLKSIVYGRADGKLQVKIGIDGNYAYRSIEYDDESRIVLDIWPVQRLSARSMANINVLGLQQIDVRKIDQEVARVTFSFSGPLTSFKIQRDERGIDILFSEAVRPTAPGAPPKKEVVIHESFGNTLFAASAGLYTVNDFLFHQIYGGEDSGIFGLELSRMLVQSRNFHMGLAVAGRRFSKTGYSTVTEEEAKFSLTPISVSARFLWNSPMVVPYVDVGVDFYSWKEESALGDTSGSTTGSHFQAGMYFKIPEVKFLMLNVYFKYNKATATHEDVEIDIGGTEVAISVSLGFNILNNLIFRSN
ncbi:MAG: AMIN domain-containing protein [Candidatus Aminicenantes bacterium]